MRFEHRIRTMTLNIRNLTISNKGMREQCQRNTSFSVSCVSIKLFVFHSDLTEVSHMFVGVWSDSCSDPIVFMKGSEVTQLNSSCSRVQSAPSWRFPHGKTHSDMFKLWPIGSHALFKRTYGKQIFYFYLEGEFTPETKRGFFFWEQMSLLHSNTELHCITELSCSCSL